MKALNPKQSASASQELLERLQGVLVYEDLNTGTRAKDVCDHLLYQIEVDADVHLNLWRFDLLRDPELNRQAASDAASADIIVLAAHGDSHLPPEVTLWLRRWIEQRPSGGNSALIVSLDRQQEFGEARILSSLRTMLESAGVDLIPHYEELVDSELPNGRPKNPVEAGATRMDTARFPSTYEHWGLNE